MSGAGPPAITEGVVVVVCHAPRLLLIRRAAGVVRSGCWCFVGGAIEPGESQADAVVREFREELGAEVRPLAKIWAYTRPDGLLRLHWWLAELTHETLAPNSAEVAEYRWCTAEEIECLPDVLESNLLFLRTVWREPDRT